MFSYQSRQSLTRLLKKIFRLTSERSFAPFQNVIDEYNGLYNNEFCEYDYIEVKHVILQYFDSKETRT